jgi:hypothetical protein
LKKEEEKMGRKENAKKSVDHGTKREKLLREKKRIPAWKISLIALLAAALPVSWLIFRDAPPAGAGRMSGSQVMENVNYQNRYITMTKVAAVSGKGLVEIPLDLVKEKKLVYFEYRQNDRQIPMLAYITPSGKLVTAVGVCEPCNSTSFHIEGNQMVCNSCFTRWDLETLKGLSGGCLTYPPDVMSHSINDGRVRIKEIDVQNWKPRILRG